MPSSHQSQLGSRAELPSATPASMAAAPGPQTSATSWVPCPWQRCQGGFHASQKLSRLSARNMEGMWCSQQLPSLYVTVNAPSSYNKNKHFPMQRPTAQLFSADAGFWGTSLLYNGGTPCALTAAVGETLNGCQYGPQTFENHPTPDFYISTQLTPQAETFLVYSERKKLSK